MILTGPPSGNQEGVFWRQCPYCACPMSRKLLNGNDIPSLSLLDTTEFALVSCTACNTTFVNPFPTEGRLMGYYPSDYYDDGNVRSAGPIHRTARLKSAVNAFSLSATKTTLDHPPRVLEVGCAHGENLVHFIQAGWESYGLEPNQRLANMAADRGVRVVRGYLTDARIFPDRMDVILMNHVLEHVSNPRDYIAVCFSLLSPSGLLFIEVPVLETVSFAICGRFYGNLEFPLHATFLSPNTLCRILREEGFVIQSRRRLGMLGTLQRTFERRFPTIRGSKSRLKFFLMLWTAACQFLVSSIDAMSFRGDAFCVVARKNAFEEGGVSVHPL
jgi:SAM-dependent methyltransferase